MSARVHGAGRGVASSASGLPKLVFGVGIFDGRSGVWCVVSLISPQQRFRPVRFREGPRGSGRFSIQCMMQSGCTMTPPWSSVRKCIMYPALSAQRCATCMYALSACGVSQQTAGTTRPGCYDIDSDRYQVSQKLPRAARDYLDCKCRSPTT
jgi:hypothetical protein